MSPEQVRGERMDARSDLFSFGVVLYEMANGVLLCRGSTSAVVFNEILSGAPANPLQRNPDLPPDLQRLIGKTLEKDREDRYQSAADMRADLRRLKRDHESSRRGRAATGATPGRNLPPEQALPAARTATGTTLPTPGSEASATPRHDSSSDAQVVDIRRRTC
jgi:eukaryotic-like serine/threonine-protein kinase